MPRQVGIFTNNSSNTVYVKWGQTQESTSACTADLPLMGDRQTLVHVPDGYTWFSFLSKSGDNVTAELICGTGF